MNPQPQRPRDDRTPLEQALDRIERGEVAYLVLPDDIFRRHGGAR